MQNTLFKKSIPHLIAIGIFFLITILYFRPEFFKINEVFISSITRIEPLSYPDQSLLEEQELNQLLSIFSIIPITPEIENIAIQLRKKYRLKLPDAIISATAYVYSARLLTNDNKISKQINEVNIQYLKKK